MAIDLQPIRRYPLFERRNLIADIRTVRFFVCLSADTLAVASVRSYVRQAVKNILGIEHYLWVH